MHLLFSLLPLTFLLTIAHPFYVTLTEISHNKKTQSLEITVKIFSDDLLKAMEFENTENVELGENLENDEANVLLKNYLSKTFQLEIDGEAAAMQYLGKEVELDATWVFLEVKDVSDLKSVKVKNTILTEHHDSQTNIVHLFINDIKKSMLFSKEYSSEQASF